jgi:hypothetical protein
MKNDKLIKNVKVNNQDIQKSAFVENSVEKKGKSYCL